MKKVILSVVAVFVAWSAMDFVIHDVILGPCYEETAWLWRPMNEMKMPLLYLTVFIAALAFVLMYSLFFARKGLSTGLLYGLLFGLATGVPMGYGSYSVMPIPYRMAFAWCLGSVVEAMVGGVFVGWIVRESERRDPLKAGDFF